MKKQKILKNDQYTTPKGRVLTELNKYKTSVGLFLHRFKEVSGLFGNGYMLPPGSEVSLDQRTKEGWYIFHVIGMPGYYVKIPEDFIDEQLEA